MSKTKKFVISAAVIGGLVIVGSVAASGEDSTPKAKHSASKAKQPAKSDDKPKKPEGDDGSKGTEKTKFFSDGDYIVGEDMPAGTYESKGASSEILDVCMVTTEPKSSSTMPKMKSGNKGERIIISLTEADGTVTIQGCHALTLR